MYRRHEVSGPDIAPGRYVAKSTTISPPGGVPADAIDGASLRLGVSYRLIDGGEKHYAWAQDEAVFYASAAHGNFTVETDRLDNLGEPIEITRPLRMSEAYPAFSRTSGTFKAAIAGQAAAKLTARANWNGATDKVAVTLTASDADAAEAYLKAVCAAELNLTLTAAETMDTSPQVNAKTIKISRRTVGCPAS